MKKKTPRMTTFHHMMTFHPIMTFPHIQCDGIQKFNNIMYDGVPSYDDAYT